MNYRGLFLSLVGLLGLSGNAAAQDFAGFEHLFTPVRSYVACQTDEEISIDGKAAEKAWKKAEWSEYFKDIEGDLKPQPLYPTRFKLMWDFQNLYFFFELEEPDIWAYYDQKDLVVYHENDIEIFIDPDRDCYDYFEFELNAQNTLFDLFLDKPYRNGGKPDIAWDASGFESAVFVDGTLNDPSDKDRKWCVEVKIPFSALSIEENYSQPKEGDIWKMNFSRVEWQTRSVDGKYVKLKDKTSGRDLPENNWIWSPQGVINMHFPERWGFVRFSEAPVGTANASFDLPHDEILARHLWLVYYKQQQFRRENKRYANTLSELSVQVSGSEKEGTFELDMQASNDDFNVTISSKNGCIVSLDSGGRITRTN
ncbi:carbohydrate-binding family 9-like protein [Maribellus sp. YY47]|uniref:carbohydrate-binding family 9-like protein n=1 Tax=Maribellus sp. YY47 TaxID=2929486 RepID=UPI0020018F07|nr:carbohydrate-binding family 9-like protein [Maribellus sp. YY47]MCK3682773.1 carbohydrate-binding family 9-like protein [Maribellus sp. YY47]